MPPTAVPSALRMSATRGGRGRVCSAQLEPPAKHAASIHHVRPGTEREVVGGACAPARSSPSAPPFEEERSRGRRERRKCCLSVPDWGAMDGDETIDYADRPGFPWRHGLLQKEQDFLVFGILHQGLQDTIGPLDDRVARLLPRDFQVDLLVEANHNHGFVARFGADQVYGRSYLEFHGLRVTALRFVQPNDMGTRHVRHCLRNRKDEHRPVGSGPVDRILRTINGEPGNPGGERGALDRPEHASRITQSNDLWRERVDFRRK